MNKQTKMLLPNFLKSKKRIKEEFLLKEYEKGRVIQVDNKINNKEFFKNKEVKKEEEPERKNVNKKYASKY